MNRYQFEDLISDYIENKIKSKDKIEFEKYVENNIEAKERVLLFTQAIRLTRILFVRRYNSNLQMYA